MAAAGAAAQPAVPAPPTATTRPPDTMAQRLVACTVCHGPQGRATASGYFPRIAGKPAGYLRRQLLNFRDGRRHNASMEALVQHLSDDYLREIAAHFGALDLPYPPPQPATAEPAVLARGEALVREGDPARGVPACVACHGDRMTGVSPAMPGLLGLPRDYLIAQLGAWRLGDRRADAPDCMAEVVKRLAPGDIVAVAQVLAARPLPADTRPAPPTTARLPLDCGSR